MRLIIKLSFITLTLSMLLAACSMPAGTPDAAATIQAVYTAQSNSVQATLTQQAGSGSATPGMILPTIAFPTLTPDMILPTIAFPSVTPNTGANTAVVPSLTPIPPPTQKPPTAYCDWAAYVKDVSVPDGTVFTPGAQFTKTWRLQNIGTCTWTSGYALVFSNGNNMSGAAASAVLSGNVKPGDIVDISVNLTAPISEGAYKGDWLLRNAAGVLFGLGSSGRSPFYVEIKVAGGVTTVYDFANSVCSATWNSGAGKLDCPASGSDKGYAAKGDSPQLENGQIYKGPGLLTVPENINNGFIQGYYPAFTVQKGDHFRSIINCSYLEKSCNAIFRLDYQINNDAVNTLWQFPEAYEGQYYSADIDLSSLAGNQVKFILTVLTNGSPKDDKTLWAGPRIDRPTNLITPSPVPTKTPTATVTAYP